ncbi:MAG: amidohydrolase family protein [Planctomycetes bacterium]|nr:amidohydrolase family protein [Planctomycetota bacterium]MBI3835805.1 amidohydrolase family protein [Planctomycetota bacterium]
MRRASLLISSLLLVSTAVPTSAQVAVRGKRVYTMAGPMIENGVVVVRDGKVAAVGPAASTPIPDGFKVLEAAVVTPGLIDAHSTVGLSGIYNIPHDQDQLEHSAPIQPELRAIDAYNPHEKLVEWVRDFGITTIHTGHAPGELISGQTLIAKTWGNTVADATIVDAATVAATLSPMAEKSEKGKSPGTRGKMMAMLRAELIKAQEYATKMEKTEPDKKPDRSLELDALVRVLKGELPMMITANRAQDIDSALRLANEFHIRIILDSGAESYLMIDQLKAANVPVIIHPTMTRAFSDFANMSFETASKLHKAGIPVAMQSGYESYVPKARVVLFEAAIAAANGLTFDEALATITIDAAKVLGVDKRVGSLEVGKDGDVAFFDGDPFEYTTHCTGVIINGQVVSDKPH